MSSINLLQKEKFLITALTN